MRPAERNVSSKCDRVPCSDREVSRAGHRGDGKCDIFIKNNIRVIDDRGGVIDRASRAGADLERAGVDRGHAGVGIHASEGERARAVFCEGTAGAGDDTARGGICVIIACREGIGTESDIARPGDRADRFAGSEVKNRTAGHTHGAGIRDRVPATHGQRAGVDGGSSGVGVGSAQNKVPAASLNERARAANGTGKVRALRDSIGAVEGERGVVCDGTARREVARRATRTDLERAGVDRGRAVVSVRARQHEYAGAVFCQAAAATAIGEIGADGRGVAAHDIDHRTAGFHDGRVAGVDRKAVP